MMAPQSSKMGDWQRFIVDYGWDAPTHLLASALGRTESDVESVRRLGACRRLPAAKDFGELFALWHGRPPLEEEWPSPRLIKPASNFYEWLSPEVALLASLVGQMGLPEIAAVLTERLRRLTGDPTAERSLNAVKVRMNRIGMQANDVLGGIVASDAGREIGSLMTVYQAIEQKKLAAFHVGRLLVIPHDAWAKWKAGKTFPPAGYVPLADLKEPLGIRSDKLSEFARAGHIPTAIRCNPFGSGVRTTAFGTWYIDPAVAASLIADRHAGRPMPWHGKAISENLRASHNLWTKRQHPDCCETCAQIWGEEGAPRTFEDFGRRYPPLAHGAKRHLTRPWDPGLTLDQVAAQAECPLGRVRQAIDNGMLATHTVEQCPYVTRTNATRWIARHCPTGEGESSWISVEAAAAQYLFTVPEIETLIGNGTLKARTDTDGAARGTVFVSRHQCSIARAEIGFTEEQAADRVGIDVHDLRKLLRHLNWRGEGGIPLVTVLAAIKRVQSQIGLTVKEAAAELRVPEQWVLDRITDGTVKVSRAHWSERVYLSESMITLLQHAKENPAPQREMLGDDWMRLSEAAFDAGVSTGTLGKWADAGELDRRETSIGWVYHRTAVRARARGYWATVRLHRAVPPTWLREEMDGREGEEVRSHSGEQMMDIGEQQPEQTEL